MKLRFESNNPSFCNLSDNYLKLSNRLMLSNFCYGKAFSVIILLFFIFKQNAYAQTAFCSCNDSITLNLSKKEVTTVLLNSLKVSDITELLNLDSINNPLNVDFENSIYRYFFVLNLPSLYYLKIFPIFPDDYSYDYLTDDPHNHTNLKIKCMYLFKGKDCISNHITLKKQKEKYSIVLPSN